MVRAPAVDQKAGWCSMCRGGSHALCASPTCACPGKPRAHPNRPSARPQEAAIGTPAHPIAHFIEAAEIAARGAA